jgi:hypothetical protein
MNNQTSAPIPATIINVPNGTKTKRLLGMEISLPWAEFVSFWANWVLVSALLLGLAATIGVVISSNAKEEHWAEEKRLAAERVSANEAETKRAIADSDIAKEGAAAANKQVAVANTEAARANERAAELERGNLELRAKLASRRISGEQHDILVAELAKSPAHFDIELMQDPESILFGGDILKTLADAGWTVDKTELPLGVFWTGLVLFQTNDPAGQILLNAFVKSGIPFAIADTNHTRPKAAIMVGNKPAAF